MPIAFFPADGYNYGMTRKGIRRRSGQAMIEYVIVLIALAALSSVIAVLLYSARSQAQRSSELVSSEYP